MLLPTQNTKSIIHTKKKKQQPKSNYQTTFKEQVSTLKS